MSDEGKDQLFKASGGNQAVSVDGVAATTPRKVSLAPLSKDAPTFEVSSPLKPISPETLGIHEHVDDKQLSELQQRIAKVKRRSADISNQLDKLYSLSDLPTDNGSE